MDIVKMDVSDGGDGVTTSESVSLPQKKYSWSEVRQAVHNLRKELSSLSSMVPMAISFRKLNNGRMRIYFLRTPQNGWEITLLYADVTETTNADYTKLEWKPLIESNGSLGSATGKWSREEQLLWERQRVAAWGIASYELHAGSGRILFPCASSLFVAAGEEDNWQSPPLVPRVLATGGGAPLTPAMCPCAPQLVAHAARGDIWLAGGHVRRPTRLTYACKGHENSLSDDPRQAGVPCYVTQEEFTRYTGFWWQPKSNDNVYRIVYEEVDESDVKIYSFPSSQSSSGEVEEFRFPRAGSSNAKSTLRMVTFELRHTSPVTVLDYYQGTTAAGDNNYRGTDLWEVCDIRWLDLNKHLQDIFPWYEYIARVGWTPCGNFVWVQILDRLQQHLELILLHIEQFCEPFHYELAPACLQQNNTSVHLLVYPEQVLLRETALNAWINVHDILHFLDPNPDHPEQISFIWASEDTGHLHLYKVVCRLITMQERRRALLETVEENSNKCLISKEAITAGEWEVMGKKIWVDKTRHLVYFLGLRETPLERHLYVANYDNPSPSGVTLLTTVGDSYSVDIDENCTMAVITQSNISTPPTTCVFRISHENGLVCLVPQGILMDRPTAESSSTSHRSYNGSRESSRSLDDRTESDELDNSSIDVVMPNKETLYLSGIPSPQIFSTRLSCGWDVYCTLWRASGSQNGQRYPTVLHVYGGPEVQTVTNCYKGIRQLRMHMLAARGFNVVSVDSRGSKHRGRAWEAAIRGKMGQVELDDQVEVLQWLAKETKCIDMERVAIHGWSYGGYLSLLGLATHPNIFKVCVAGAPVTCWRLYDTAYTERYMGLPNHSPHAYTRASVLAHAPFFPDQEGRLLIIHGLADENVHFCHTAALLSELVRLNKPHRVQVYPGERHSLRALHAAKHYEATLLHFLHENL